MAKKNPYNVDISESSKKYGALKESGGNPYDQFGADNPSSTASWYGKLPKIKAKVPEPPKKKSVLNKLGGVLTAPGNYIAEKAYAPLRKQQNKAADQALEQEKIGIPNTTPSEAAQNTKDIASSIKKKLDPRELPIIKPALSTAKTAVDIQTQGAQNKVNQKATEDLDKLEQQAHSDFKAGKISKGKYQETLLRISGAQQKVAKNTQKISGGITPVQRGIDVADTGLNVLGLGQGGFIASEFADQAGKQGIKTAITSQLPNIGKNALVNAVQGTLPSLANKPTIGGVVKGAVTNAVGGTALDIGVGGAGVAASKELKKLSPVLSDAEKITMFNDAAEKAKGALKPLKQERDNLVSVKQANPGFKQVDEAISKVDKKIEEVQKTVQNADDAKVQTQVKEIATKEKEATKPKKQPVVYKPIKETPRETPEIKTSKLASSTNQKAIDAKLTKGFEGLPEYAKVNVKDQSKAAVKLLEEDGERARRIALGQERPPEGLLPESVYVALEDSALKSGDVSLLRELATSSSLTSEATGMGQRLRLLAERDPDSAVTAMRAVADERRKAIEKQLKQPVSRAIKDTTREIKSMIKVAPTKTDWGSFVESLKC